MLKIISVSRVEQILLSGQWKEKTTVTPSPQRIVENLPLSSKPYEIMKKKMFSFIDETEIKLTLSSLTVFV